jgi:hypothetical protein
MVTLFWDHPTRLVGDAVTQVTLVYTRGLPRAQDRGIYMGDRGHFRNCVTRCNEINGLAVTLLKKGDGFEGEEACREPLFDPDHPGR